jgi:hypothetical protein
MNVNTANNNYAYINTASNMIELSQADYENITAILSLIPDMSCPTNGLGKSKIFQNCRSTLNQCSFYASYYASKFPDITVTIDNIPYTIPSSAYLVDGPNTTVSQICQVMIGQTTTGSAGIVLGTPFLKQYYTVFDYSTFTSNFTAALNPPILNS